MNAKQIWAWFCGFAAGPLAFIVPHLSAWDFHYTNFEKGGIVLSILAGLGLVNMKKPADHSQDNS